jgi:CubicO group peptidase (beta-lactamase class C family)
MKQFVTAQPGTSWALGWDTPSQPSSSGQWFSPESFGHLGFTGTSIWIDPTRDLEVIFLSNRVHPTRDNQAIKAFRPKLHDAIIQELGA